MGATTLFAAAGSVIIGVIVGYVVRQSIVSKQSRSIEQRMKDQLEESRGKGKEIVLEAQEQAARILEDIKREERERKNQLDKSEERIAKREETLDKELSDIREKEKSLAVDVQKVVEAKGLVEELKKKINGELERVAGLSREQARDSVIADARVVYAQDLSEYTQKMMKERRDEIEHKAVDILATAIQRYSRSSVSDLTTSTVPLPDEDFKGKIIGKEGRNIRTLERLTGVELIIDETPDSIVISSFDPVRREIAKGALEKLIKDGRIQPAKIEEKVEEATQEISKKMTEAGEAAAYELGIFDLPKEIVQLLGRLHYRTSYGQNVLQHSIEMAYFSEMIAQELGLRADLAKKAALVHDIGKAIDHEVQGTHVEIGRKILKKYNLNEDVIRAMESHHEEYPYTIPEAYIVSAADAISAGRPGARRDTIENYLKRLTELEAIATSFDSVKTAYAISAGRELRIFVTPEKVDDFGALELARQVANRVQSELKYPGEIRVVVIRETRAVEYAK